MAKGISDLDTQGFIYITEPDGTSIVSNIVNDKDGVREAKLFAVQAAANSAAIRSFGSVKIITIGTGGNITGIGIASFNYMANPIDVTGLTQQQAAEAVAVEVNSTDQTAFTLKVTATAVNDEIFFFAPQEDGSTPNGTVISPTTDTPAQITFSTISFANGAGTNSIFDESSGYRIFLNANYDAAATSCAGDGVATQGDLTNSIEITDDFINILPTNITDSVEIINGAITTSRKGKDYSVEVNTEGSAVSDTLNTISPAGHAGGDIIRLRGQNLTRIVTATSGGNIALLNNNDFVSGDYSKVIVLQLFAKGGVGQDQLFWFQIAPASAVPSIADQRAATPAIPVIATEGEGAIAATVGGTTTLKANVDNKYQVVTGSATLTGDFIVFFSTVGAIAGDEFFVRYDAQITEASNKVRIGGASKIPLKTQQALIGGWWFYAYYTGTAWRTVAFPSMGTTDFKFGPEFLLANGITPIEVTEEMRTEIITIPVSLDDADELGDHKIRMSYAGKVVGIDYAVSKDIQPSNDGSIVAKNNVMAVMATTSINAGSAIGTIFSESPTVNNTFVAGDILTFTSAKSTVGGKVFGSLKITRT